MTDPYEYPAGSFYIIRDLKELDDHQVFRAHVLCHMLGDMSRHWRVFTVTRMEVAYHTHGRPYRVQRDKAFFMDPKTMRPILMIQLSLLEILYGILVEMTFNRQIINV